MTFDLDVYHDGSFWQPFRSRLKVKVVHGHGMKKCSVFGFGCTLWRDVFLVDFRVRGAKAVGATSSEGWLVVCWYRSVTVCRLETLDRQLQDRKTSFTSFNADAREFLAWLTRAEVALTNYEEMAVTDLSTNEDQQGNSQRTFNVCVVCRLKKFSNSNSLLRYLTGLIVNLFANLW